MLSERTSKRKQIAKYKSRFIRGSSYLGIFLSLFSVAGLAKLLGINISFFVIVLLTTVGYFGGCYFMGYIDEVKGIWKDENNYCFEVAPMSSEQYEKIEYIYRWVKEQENNIAGE